MIRPPPRPTRVRSSAASDVYKRQVVQIHTQTTQEDHIEGPIRKVVSNVTFKYRNIRKACRSFPGSLQHHCTLLDPYDSLVAFREDFGPNPRTTADSSTRADSHTALSQSLMVR